MDQLNGTPSGATFMMINGRDGFMTDMCHWESLFKTYRHIATCIGIHFEPEELIELEWRNESDPLNGGWMEYPEDPPQWLPTYWSVLSLKRLASVWKMAGVMADLNYGSFIDKIKLYNDSRARLSEVHKGSRRWNRKEKESSSTNVSHRLACKR